MKREKKRFLFCWLPSKLDISLEIYKEFIIFIAYDFCFAVYCFTFICEFFILFLLYISNPNNYPLISVNMPSGLRAQRKKKDKTFSSLFFFLREQQRHLRKYEQMNINLYV